MYIKNSEYLSKYTGAEIDAAIEHMRNIELEFDAKVDKTQTINGHKLTGNIQLTPEDIGAPSLEDIGNATITFIQNGIERGSITTNQKEDATIEFIGGGSGGGSISELSDVEIDELQNGQTLVYDSETEKWKNGSTTSVVFVDWSS